MQFSTWRIYLTKPLLVLLAVILSGVLVNQFYLKKISAANKRNADLALQTTRLLDEVKSLERQKSILLENTLDFKKLDDFWFQPLARADFVDSLNSWVETKFAKNLMLRFSDADYAARQSFAGLPYKDNLIMQTEISLKITVQFDIDFFDLLGFITREFGQGFLVKNCYFERIRFEDLSQVVSLPEPSLALDCELVYFYLDPSNFSGESYL